MATKKVGRKNRISRKKTSKPMSRGGALETIHNADELYDNFRAFRNQNLIPVIYVGSTKIVLNTIEDAENVNDWFFDNITREKKDEYKSKEIGMLYEDIPKPCPSNNDDSIKKDNSSGVLNKFNRFKSYFLPKNQQK